MSISDRRRQNKRNKSPLLNIDFNLRRSIPPLLLLMLIACVLAFSFQGTRGLWEPDEGRYTNVALEMMRSGDYFLPHRHHETLHVTKPPVIYWSLAASMNAFGLSEWAVRLPMALAFIFTVFLVFQLGRSFTPDRPWLPALIYASSPLPFFAANIITTDTVLAFVEASAVLAFVRYRIAGASPRYLDAMWALFGLAFMVKGPPGLLPLLVIVIWQWRNGSIKPLVRPLGILSFVIIGFTWFFLITQYSPELLDYFLRHEVIDRVASATHDRNSQWYGGLLVYLPTLLIGALPWLAIGFCLRFKSPMEGKASPETGFLLAWIVLPLIIFMLSRSRLPLYILPLFVPISLLLAMSMRGLVLYRRHLIWLFCWILVLIAAKGFAGHMHSKQDSREMARKLRPLLPETPKELVFIDSKAFYGLDFYLDTEIEKISLPVLVGKQALSDSEFDQDMLSEMLEPEHGRYFLVPKQRMPALRDFLRENRYRSENLGAVGKFEVLAIKPQ